MLRAQEESLLLQRLAERRQAVLHAAVRSLEASLAEAEGRARDGLPSDDGVTLTISSAGVEAAPATEVLWLPRRPPLSPALDGFAGAELAEFSGNPNAALAF